MPARPCFPVLPAPKQNPSHSRDDPSPRQVPPPEKDTAAPRTQLPSKNPCASSAPPPARALFFPCTAARVSPSRLLHPESPCGISPTPVPPVANLQPDSSTCSLA